MHLEDIQVEKRDVLHVNYVKRFVLRKLLQSKLSQERMEVEELLDMTLI